MECVICFEEFEVPHPNSKVNRRSAIGYPGWNVYAIFIGVVFVIGSVMATVVQCISLDLRQRITGTSEFSTCIEA